MSETNEITKWSDIPDIKDELLRGIFSYGFENPSPIQKKAIVPALKNVDLIAQAQSGTGKTGAFTIASLQKIDTSLDKTQVLILSPTRELSEQIYKVVLQLGEYMSGLRTTILVGGTRIDGDIIALNKNPHIVVGCPGRVHDMIRRNKLKALDLEFIVIDEADEMLSSGFKEQIYNIFQHFSTKAQIAIYSATLPQEIEELSHKFMREPEKILVKAESLTLEGIKQYYVAVDNDAVKYETLKDLFSTLSVSQSIIYCNSTGRVEELANAMTRDGFPVVCVHGKMDVAERQKNFNEFKSGSARVLISSNLTARGIDIQQVSIVINFDIPTDVQSYLHRIGRSGRWGRKGMGINFVSRFDVKLLREIESFYSTQIDEMPASVVSVC